MEWLVRLGRHGFSFLGRFQVSHEESTDGNVWEKGQKRGIVVVRSSEDEAGPSPRVHDHEKGLGDGLG